MRDPKSHILEIAARRGVVRPRDLKALGIHQEYLHQLVAEGKMIRQGRGLYSSPDFDFTETHTMVQAVSLQGNAVVSLLSALRFHELGTQIPHQVWLAVPHGAWISRQRNIPARTVTMGSPGFEAGVEIHKLEGKDVRMYSIPKTIADCFKYRSKVGLDVALEALSEALRERRCTRDEIRQYAEINRVENVMRPYMESFSL